MSQDGPSADPFALLRSRRYVVLLLLAALLGVPISVAAYFFLAAVGNLQEWLFTDLPSGLGFADPPAWWPFPLLFVSGLIVGLTVRYLPGNGGHSPADGFHAGGPPAPLELPGIFIAALASLALGAVIGPEAPLIALGGGLAALLVELRRRDAPAEAVAVLGATGSFAAISTLMGSPLPAALLMLEAAGIGGSKATAVLMPGLLAAGVGSLVFVGLDSWTGLGTFALALPGLPRAEPPTLSELGWAVVIGAGAALLGTAIRRLALLLRGGVKLNTVVFTPRIGLAVAALAVVYSEATGHPTSDVLFSGQTSLPALVQSSDDYAVDALLLLIVCKSLAYAGSLSAFRGGPIFPALFVGASAGIALSHLPGLTLTAGVAIGMGAMSATMVRLPLTSVLLAAVLVSTTGPDTIPLVIVAVVVSFMTTAALESTPKDEATGTAGQIPAPQQGKRPDVGESVT